MIVPARNRIVIRGNTYNTDAPSGVKEIVNPAVNVAGVIIHRVVVYTPASEHIVGYADTAAPTSQWDIMKRVIFAFGGPDAGSRFLDGEIDLSPGLGFWIWHPSNAAKARITYEVLS